MSEVILPVGVEGKVVQTLQEGERFACFKLEQLGGFAFLKVLRDDELRPRLQREVDGNKAFTALVAAHPDAGFRVPKLYGQGEDWVLTEWIDGEPLVDDYTPQNIAHSASSVAAAHAFTDNYLPRPGEPTRFSDIQQEVTDKFSKREVSRYFNEQVALEALGFAIEHLSVLTATRAHADLTPRHLLKQVDGTIAIVDFEGSRDDWPRFYECINYWGKLTILYDQSEVATTYLADFFRRINSSVEGHDTELRVNAAVRLLWHICELVQPDGTLNERFTPERAQRIDTLLRALPRTAFTEILAP